jgi:RNA polymerase sigma-70 factor (ECF subfamily)
MTERLRDKARRGKGGTYDRRRTARRGAQCRRHRPLKALQGFGDGHEQILTFLDTAEPFGEVPLLDGGSDPASVMRRFAVYPEPTVLSRVAVIARGATLDNPSDLEQVFARYVNPIYRFMYSRVGNREDAEDLTSEVFMKATGLLEVGRTEPSIAAWLFTVARTVLADHWRKYYRRGDTVELDELELLHVSEQTESSRASEQHARLLEQVMSGLPDRYRRVLELRFLHGYTIQETATEMGISPNNAKVVQHRALAQAFTLVEESISPDRAPIPMGSSMSQSVSSRPI